MKRSTIILLFLLLGLSFIIDIVQITVKNREVDRITAIAIQITESEQNSKLRSDKILAKLDQFSSDIAITKTSQEELKQVAQTMIHRQNQLNKKLVLLEGLLREIKEVDNADQWIWDSSLNGAKLKPTYYIKEDFE